MGGWRSYDRGSTNDNIYEHWINETSRIYLTITILDDLEVRAADIERVCDLYISEKYIYITWVLVCSVLWK